jgi:predicted ArsR family transcriptional regulator
MSQSKIENPKSKIAAALPLIEQREIEARIVGPLIRAFITEIGEQRTLEIVRDLIRNLARQGGSNLAKALGDHSLEAFARGLDRWRENDALEIEMLEQSPTRLSFNVTRCRYAEMYSALGLADLGASLSCERDFALVQGFNPEIELTRTQTIMEGAACCDFRFRHRASASTGENEPSDPSART